MISLCVDDYMYGPTSGGLRCRCRVIAPSRVRLARVHVAIDALNGAALFVRLETMRLALSCSFSFSPLVFS